MEILKSELFKNFSKQEIEQLLNSNFIYQNSIKNTNTYTNLETQQTHSG